MISVYEAERHGPVRRHRLQKIIFFLRHLIKKSRSTTVVLKRGPQSRQRSFFQGVDTFFENNLIFTIWVGNIIISFVAPLQPYIGS